MENKVLITGINIVSSLGFDLQENWNNLLSGKSGVSRIEHFDTTALQTRIAAQIPPGFDEYTESLGKKKRLFSQMTRVTKLGFICACEAIGKSGVDFSKMDRTRAACILGIVSSGYNSTEKPDPKKRIIKSMSNALPAWISMQYGLEGPAYSVASACSSSAYAIGVAYDLIKNNCADLVITGGADSIINPEEIEGFNELFALATDNSSPEKASCPFSSNRDGFVPGEGAGFLILESEKSAKARNAEIFAQIAGYALTSEAFNIMAPRTNGEGMAITIESALRKSEVSKEQINYINAHGTSTTLNDLYETTAIKSVFGEKALHIPVSSSKSMIGHTIGAAGAIELGISAMSVKHGKITPTINYSPDPELDLDYVPDKARDAEIQYAMSNSFGFGGHNASIIIKKYTE